MKNSDLKFTGIIVKEGRSFISLCPQLDVSSCGKSEAKAKRMLEEAVTLYLETAITSNLPYLRPTPASGNPLVSAPETVVSAFDFDVSVRLIAHAA